MGSLDDGSVPRPGRISTEIYLAFGENQTLSRAGDWGILAAYLPIGILFGAAHPLTPGHSKSDWRPIWQAPQTPTPRVGS